MVIDVSEDMMAGRPNNGGGPFLSGLKARAAVAMAWQDELPNDDTPGRVAVGSELCHPGCGPEKVFDPIVNQYGRHVKFGAIVSPGITIGNFAVFDVRSDDTMAVPERGVAACNPARVKRSIDE